MTEKFDPSNSELRMRFDSVVAPSQDSQGDRYRLIGSKPAKREPSKKAAFLFGSLTAVAASVGVLTVLILAILGHPFRASFLLGVGMIVLGVLRAVWWGQPWFASRQKWLDVTVFVLTGIAILCLAPSTATMVIV